MADSKILGFLLFLSLCDLCLFTYTHKHTGGELLRMVKTGLCTHRWCAPLVNFRLNAALFTNLFNFRARYQIMRPLFHLNDFFLKGIHVYLHFSARYHPIRALLQLHDVTMA